jgi:TetR/AcrR family transcriptional repressor of nem operon
MPRTRQISDEDVLTRAAALFWRHGYAGTSLRDLMAATGLSAAALYHRYGDKDGFFRAALEHYAEQSVAPRLGRLAGAARPLAAIAAFFDDIVAVSADDPDRLGCLLVNTALDGGPMSETARAAAASRLAAIEAAFRQALDRAAHTGALPRGVDPALAAESLLAKLIAIRVFARLGADRDRLQRRAAEAQAILTAN